MNASPEARTGGPAERGPSFVGGAANGRALGASGIELPAVAFGAWGIGGAGWGGGASGDDARAAVARAVELGLTFFDTAPTYGDGASEALLGEVLPPVRARVRIATKCGPFDDPAASLDASLTRLRTDHVDLYQLHELPPAPGALEKQLLAMRSLAEQGLARAIGLCNATGDQLARACEIAPIVSHQGPYNLFDRDAERDVLAVARARGVAFLAYRPLASGLLTGKFREPPRFAAGDHRSRIYWFRGREFARRSSVIERLSALAEEQGVTLAQLALAWTFSRPGVTSVLAGARTVAQVEENARALEVVLAPDIIGRIEDAVAAAYPPRRLRNGVRLSPATDATGEIAVVTGDGATRPQMSVGAREAFVMRRLDGRSTYIEIADAWRAESGHRMMIAQVVTFVDQLDDLGLLAAE